MNVVLIGTGNVAYHLAHALRQASHTIADIYGRNESTTRRLAEDIHAEKYCTDIQNIYPNADVYIFAVSDTAIGDIARMMPHTTGIWCHTAGSVHMEVLQPYHQHVGVLYPLQTLSRADKVNFQSQVPLLIEGTNALSENTLYALARSISAKVEKVSSLTRKKIHLAAVFASNFTNHMYAIAQYLLTKEELSFDLLLPLIDQTASKVQALSPLVAQTGPAIRGNKSIIESHLSMLTEEDKIRDIYHLVSENIQAIALSNHKPNK